MTRPEARTGLAHRRPASLWRLLSCIRFDEVCVLQGAPVIGACFAMTDLRAATLFTIAALIAGNLLLVAHVFVLNDWAGTHGDQRDPMRADGTYLAKGENAARMGRLAWTLLALALLVFALIGQAPFVIALLIALLSAIYSLPGLNGKGVPMLNSLLHVVGGTLHFLLGYLALSPLSPQGVVIGCYFGLVFAAGHLVHETRDHDSDLRNGIRTNAVAFGKKTSFLTGLFLFSMAYITLTVMALRGLVPLVLSLAIVLYALHLGAAWQALRDGLTYASVRRLQTVYRNIHVVIGLAMLATVVPW
ncbi:UbiA family prenyltransferase [Variovorax sp. OV084]|jgi:4-hydroxybenzoate polyprenyltransferase|uniref:UbiA family prenyltransferase n=1 Tax=Variovorax sp. OV084 TaxID=1882777 RepID=UPI0008BE735B|nr:UbiA family prenyltransferase [Variovorax sp. OV084]SEU22362.1 4-hydroxybenzoate polyprenyltransferase [Variovorax sp. OV084]